MLAKLCHLALQLLSLISPFRLALRHSATLARHWFVRTTTLAVQGLLERLPVRLVLEEHSTLDRGDQRLHGLLPLQVLLAHELLRGALLSVILIA